MRKQRLYFVGPLDESVLLQGAVATTIGKEDIDFAQPLTLQEAEKMLVRQRVHRGGRKLHLYKIVPTTLEIEETQ